MEAQLIDLSNYDIALVQSSAGRAGSPDGNVFFDTTGKIEYIRADELATLDLSGGINTPAVQIDVVASAGTYTRASGDFVAEGFKAGRSFAFSGFTNGGNNTTKVIGTVTALVITVTDNTGLVDETGSGDEVVTSVSEANPLTIQLGLKFEASYAFENQERRTDEALRKFDRWTSGTFKYGGAYNYINSRKPSTDADRTIMRGSGWNEYASDGGIDRIYYGNLGLGSILSGSQPYQQLSSLASPDLNTLVPADFAKLGQFNEAVQVYGDTGNVPSDAGAGDFDTTAYEAVSVRTFGQNYDRKESTTDLGIAELGGYFSGFAVTESEHLTTKNYTLDNVYTTPIAPFDTMSLEKLAAPVVRDEFSDQTGTYTFSWVLNNPGTGTNASPVAAGNLDQMVAFMDAVSQDDADMDSGTETVTYGKRVATFYSYDAEGKVVLISGADSLGFYMYNVPTADQQRVTMTDDSGVIKYYSFSVSVEADIGATAKSDLLSWYHSYFAALYNTSGAVPVQDKNSDEVKGSSSTADADNKIIYPFDYTGDTVGGTADTDKDCVFVCEGDGGATQAKTLYTIKKLTTIAFACSPGVENNA